jgi:large subunit ribosomal protein L9
MKIKVILLERIPNLGNLGDVVLVEPGFARNYLIPQGLAVRATEESIKAFEAKREVYLRKQNENLAVAKDRHQQINGQSFEIKAKAGVDGKLFGSVGSADIVEAAQNAGIKLDKSEVLLPNGSFKVIGEFDINIVLHHDVEHATIKINIVSEA